MIHCDLLLLWFRDRHKGPIICGTVVERFEKANNEFFEPFLRSIEPVK